MGRRRAVVAGLVLAACGFTTGPLSSAGGGGSTSDGPEGAGTSVTTDMPAGVPTSSSSTGSSAGGDSTTGPGDSSTTGDDNRAGDCCEAQAGPGCADPDVEACVCDVDRYCCDNTWDAQCAAHTETLGCGSCAGADATETGGAPGDCCLPGSGPSCTDDGVAQCVCALDPFCCDDTWDEFCAELVKDAGCGSCGGGPPTNDTSCCSFHFEPGCEEVDVEACVCAFDEYCCQVAWDTTCVELVEALSCGPCEGFSGSSSGSDTGSGSTT